MFLRWTPRTFKCEIYMHGETVSSQYQSQFKDQMSYGKNQSPPYFQLPDIVWSKNLKLTLEAPSAKRLP